MLTPRNRKEKLPFLVTPDYNLVWVATYRGVFRIPSDIYAAAFLTK